MQFHGRGSSIPDTNGSDASLAFQTAATQGFESGPLQICAGGEIHGTGGEEQVRIVIYPIGLDCTQEFRDLTSELNCTRVNLLTRKMQSDINILSSLGP